MSTLHTNRLLLHAATCPADRLGNWEARGPGKGRVRSPLGCAAGPTVRRGTAKPAAVPGHSGGAIGTQSAGSVAELAWSPEETGRKQCPRGQRTVTQETDRSLNVNSTNTRKHQGKRLKRTPVTNQGCETRDRENEIKLF